MWNKVSAFAMMLVIMLSGAVMFTSCEEDGDGVGSHGLPKDLIGTWRIGGMGGENGDEYGEGYLMIDGTYFVLSDDDHMSDADENDTFVIVKYDGSTNKLYVAEEGDLDDYVIFKITSLTSTKMTLVEEYDGGTQIWECTKISSTVKQ